MRDNISSCLEVYILILNGLDNKMNNMKLATLAAMSTLAESKEVGDGRCPYPPGKLVGNVSENLDTRKI